MILKISTKDDETTMLPDERKRGDIMSVHDDAFIPGRIEKCTNLFVKVPDPPNIAKFQAELVRSEYGNTQTQAQTAPTIKHRIWFLPYWETLEQSVIDIVDADSDADENDPGYQDQAGVNYLDNGQIAGGGTVVRDGIIEGIFTVRNCRDK